MQKHKTNSDRTYRRSHVALFIGLLALTLSAVFAVQAKVGAGDLFAGLMAGAGAIGALMAAYEAADAAEGAAEAAKRANELTLRQSIPVLVLTGVERYYHDGFDPRLFAFLDVVAIDNVGATYTASRRINVYLYRDGIKQFAYGTSNRNPLLAGTGHEHKVQYKERKLLRLSNLQGYAIEVFTIHGTSHRAIGWVIPHRDSLYTIQLGDLPLPENLPPFPSDAQIN